MYKNVNNIYLSLQSCQKYEVLLSCKVSAQTDKNWTSLKETTFWWQLTRGEIKSTWSLCNSKCSPFEETRDGNAVATAAAVPVDTEWVCTTIELVSMVQPHWSPGYWRKQALNKAISNAGLVPTNKLLPHGAPLVAVPHWNVRQLMKAGYKVKQNKTLSILESKPPYVLIF